MSRGDSTRQTILERSVEVASRLGLGGLTIGTLADDLKMSKSGLFAHFKSKDALQVETLAFAADHFVEAVIRPALREPRGEPRVRALFERWIEWSESQPGGCILGAAAFELDDQPGPARDALAKNQRDWLDTLAQAIRAAQREGHFSTEVAPEDMAFTMLGFVFALHHGMRLLGDPEAKARALRSFDRLVVAARSPERQLAIAADARASRPPKGRLPTPASKAASPTAQRSTRTPRSEP
jgi:AcrR family transcriptional regulator